MTYPDTSNLRALTAKLQRLTQLKHERGAADVSKILEQAETKLQQSLNDLADCPDAPELNQQEPDELESIQHLRPQGPRTLTADWPRDKLEELIRGAFLGRCAGCILGSPVEFYSIDRMTRLARENKQQFPPAQYWLSVPDMYGLKADCMSRHRYTQTHMDGVPVDDDLVYTVLGLLAIEQYGADFTTNQLGELWKNRLTHACTAERTALDRLLEGIPGRNAADPEDPMTEWIGGWIRADPWAYAAPGWPEKAASMAWSDAMLTHRRNGVYGTMFFAAAISAAFAVDDPFEALEAGLAEIPEQCRFANEIRWALDTAEDINNYREARARADERFDGMHHTHAINNASLVVFGLALGKTDFDAVIGNTVAMGMDNDCTAATAGSLFGATYGRNAIPDKWIHPFDDRIYTYISGHEELSLEDVVCRFTTQALKVTETD